MLHDVVREDAVNGVSYATWVSLVEVFQLCALLVVNVVVIRRWFAIAIDGAVRRDRSVCSVGVDINSKPCREVFPKRAAKRYRRRS